MPWNKIGIQPGVVKDITRYAASGGWVDSSLVRFRNGFPERWLGWSRYLEDTTLDGVCRSLYRWALLNGLVYLGIGTNTRFYIASDDAITDVTPVLSSATLNNALATTNGSTRVVVNDVAHGVWPGNYVIISGATAFNGLTTGQLNAEHTVSEYIDDDNYAIVVSGSAANATGSGGGAAILVEYLFKAGSEDQVYGGGWGSGAWGEEEWGGAVLSGNDKLGMWSQKNWGEDLVACAYDGPIFYWDASTPTARMVDIRDLPGADGFAPTYARFIAISHRDRHLIAFGPSNEFGDTDPAPMTIRWCSQEDITNWNEADLAGTAGSIPLSRGSQFVAVVQTTREYLVWSDTTLYSLQFVGAPDVYVAEIMSASADIAGMNAGVAMGTDVFWMGRSGFYYYDGRVNRMPCPVWNYIKADINISQSNKVFCSTNRTQDEVIWYYPSNAGLENDKYVAYDVTSDAWTVGILSRTAWIDMDFQYAPLATDPDGKMFFHETGQDDGSQNPPVPLDAYVESGPFEMSSEGSFDKGDRFLFLRRILPDVYFPYLDGTNTPQMNMTIKAMDKPGGGFGASQTKTVSFTLEADDNQQFTDELHVRLRGRSATLRLESNTLGSAWRFGMPRFDIRPDGQR